MMHSWNDRRTHEFFFEKGYPEPAVLERVFQALGPKPRTSEELALKLRFGGEEIETALEKLWIHGGALFVTEGGQQVVTRGKEGWLAPYKRQREHKQGQLDEVQRYADGQVCRMVALVRHFGDQEDAGRPCGICDVCDANACLVRTARPPEPREREAAAMVLAALRDRDGQATGRLHTACLGSGLDRRTFEEVLGGLVRSGLLRVTNDTFAKEGRDISFKRAWLTPAARKAASAGEIEFTLAAEAEPAPGARSRRARGKGAKEKPPGGGKGGDPELVSALKQWRLAEARKAGVPAFRVLHDRTLVAIAAARPQDEGSLLEVPGFGPGLLKRYGNRLLDLCRTGLPQGSRSNAR